MGRGCHGANISMLPSLRFLAYVRFGALVTREAYNWVSERMSTIDGYLVVSYGSRTQHVANTSIHELRPPPH